MPPKKRFFRTLAIVGTLLGLCCAVAGWVMLSTPGVHRTGPGVALALGAAGLWLSFAGFLVYGRVVGRGQSPRVSQLLIWAGMTASTLGALSFVVF